MHFEKKSLSQKIFYRPKLYSAKLEKGVTMLEHVNYLKTLSDHLEAVGDRIEEKDLVIILISSLTEDYNYLITALETIAEERLNWVYVRDRVLHTYEKIHNTTEVTTVKVVKHDDVLFSNKAGIKRSESTHKKCFYCQKEGHFAKNCFKKKADRKAKLQAESAKTVEHQDDGDGDFVLTVNNSDKQACDDWWIDSGASQHMSFNNSGMINYMKFSMPQEIKLADNSIVFAYGKGNIRLPCYDGSKRINLMLKDVLFIPKLRKNLLSLSTVTERGNEVLFKGEFCKLIVNGNASSIGHKHEALNTAVYLRNRSPTVALSGLIPYECMYGKKPDEDNIPNAVEEEDEPPRRSTRKRNVPERLGTLTGDWWTNEDLECSAATFDGMEPTNIHEALNGKHAPQWKKAIESEYKSLIKNETWELVDLPADKNLVGCKWVFKTKRNSDGSISRYKARLVAQGYSQEAGIDYDELYAPVARYNSIRTVLTIANALYFEIHQMDVKTAFLNGKLEQEIFMKQPDGCINKRYPEKVCKLQRSLYGLKQSTRCWNQEIDGYLKLSGYTLSDADSCIYTKSKRSKGDKISLMITALYVDDILLATNDSDMLETEKKAMSQRFEMEDQSEAHFCLGMAIICDRKRKNLRISQKSYLENVLRRFGMSECRSIATPLEAEVNYSKLSDRAEGVDIKELQAANGSLNYAEVPTRPDLSVAIGKLSQLMSNPSQEHWQGIKRVFRYVKGTLDYCLEYDGNSTDLQLKGYADADWAGDTDTRKSTSSYVFQVAGCTISWRSQKQAIVALSSTETEYVSMSFAAQEAIWLRRLLNSLEIKKSNPCTLYEDNQGAIALSKNPTNHPRTKHIDVKYHFIRETITNKQIEIEYCETNKMIADVMTKGLPKGKFQELCLSMGIKD
eukprot:gene2751-biopygen2271